MPPKENPNISKQEEIKTTTGQEVRKMALEVLAAARIAKITERLLVQINKRNPPEIPQKMDRKTFEKIIIDRAAFALKSVRPEYYKDVKQGLENFKKRVFENADGVLKSSFEDIQAFGKEYLSYLAEQFVNHGSVGSSFEFWKAKRKVQQKEKSDKNLELKNAELKEAVAKVGLPEGYRFDGRVILNSKGFIVASFDPKEEKFGRLVEIGKERNGLPKTEILFYYSPEKLLRDLKKDSE